MENRSFLGSLMKGDNWIWGIYWILLVISVIEIGSATSTLAYKSFTNDNPLVRHTMFLMGGFFFFLLTGQSLTSLRPDTMQKLAGVAFVLGVILAYLMPIFGRRVNGASRDILGIQPVELIKVGLVVTLCSVITMRDRFFQQYNLFRERTELRRFYLMLAMVGIAAFPILLQNLSSALIIGMVSVGIMFLGGVNMKYLFRTLLLLAAVGSLCVGALYGLHLLNESHEKAGLGHYTDMGSLDRPNTWEKRIFDGSSVPLWQQDIDDENMQVMYAHMAIANSRTMGRFFGNSEMRDHLPEAYSDYIYSIIFEEMGVLGAAFVMLLYFILLVRCYHISKNTSDPFKRLVMLGIPLLIIIQALIHMGVCADAMFVTGQPLPLISRGGMSILSTSACFGILCGMSHSIAKENSK